MNNNNFKSVYGLAHSLYGISMDPDVFEDVALNGWQQIGNKNTRLHRYTTNTENGKIKLPCNADIIEAVFLPTPDANDMDNIHGYNYYNMSVEYYNESIKKETNPFYNRGHLVKYRIEGEYLVLDKDYDNVIILYHGVITDDEGLPYLSDKEVQALAAYIAYFDIYKKSIMLKDGNLVNLANIIKTDWIRLCNAARIPNHISQNDMNDILDVKTRYDRKMYGKSFKPML